MEINYQNLVQYLQKAISQVYLIHGDEPLLVQTARDKIKRAVQAKGYHNRELLIMDQQFNWGKFIELTQNFNLFSNKTLIDLRNPTTKFDKKGNEILINYLTHPPADTILMISLPKLSAAQQKTKWYLAAKKVGVCIKVWPVKNNELPQWLQKVCQHRKIKIDSDGIQLLAELTQGNLLAAKQAIDKLQLCYAQQTINAQHVAAAVSNNARFNIFDLSAKILAGDSAYAIKILLSLKNEGIEPIFVLWTITREIRELIKLKQTDHLQSQWQSRRQLLKQALERLSTATLNELLIMSGYIDEIIKGIRPGNTWEALINLVLSISHTRLAFLPFSTNPS